MTPTVTAPTRVPDRLRRPASHRTHTPARRPASARTPRRVSGPLGGRTAVARAPRERIAIGGRALAVVRGLPDHSLIDRLVRGRAWIPVLGVLLAGIVAMQVEILKLGSSMGKAMERSSTLQTQNEALQANVAGLADDQRIERLASGMGMTVSTPDSLVFLSARPNSDGARAAGNIHAPDPVGFTNQLAAQAAAVAALMPSAPTSTSGGPSGVTLSAVPAAPAPAISSPTSSGTSTPTVGSPPSAGAAPAATAPTSSSAGTGASSGTAAGAGAPGGAGSATGGTATGSGGGTAAGVAGVAPAGTSASGGTSGG